MTSYNYSKSIDVLYNLEKIIYKDASLDLDGIGNSILEIISYTPGEFTIVFQDALSVEKKTILDTIVANYVNAFVRNLNLFSSFNLNQFLSELSSNENISANILDARVLDDKVSINFDTELTNAEVTEIDTIIANFSTTPMYLINNGIENQYVSFNKTLGMGEIKTKSKYYEVVYSYVFAGSVNEPPPKHVNVITQKEGSYIASYDARVYDLTNSNFICEKTGMTNSEVDFVDLGTVSNIPTTSAVWEIHIRANFDSNKDEKKNRDFVFLRGFYLSY